jgi:hypothetical protein
MARCSLLSLRSIDSASPATTVRRADAFAPVRRPSTGAVRCPSDRIAVRIYGARLVDLAARTAADARHPIR